MVFSSLITWHKPALSPGIDIQSVQIKSKKFLITNHDNKYQTNMATEDMRVKRSGQERAWGHSASQMNISQIQAHKTKSNMTEICLQKNIRKQIYET